MRQLRALLPLTVALGALASVGVPRANAQAMSMAASNAMPESYRQVQLSALDMQRRLLLAMADSMPESLYRDKVTPIQRDFAQQLQHAAMPFATLVPRFLGVPAPTGLPDSATTLNSRVGMRAYINGVFDYAAGVLRSQTAADREAHTTFFGSDMPKWKVWDELHQHTWWTAGQVVANFRKNGMAPPGFGFF